MHLRVVCNVYTCICVCVWVYGCECNLYTFVHITNYIPRTILYICLFTHTPSTRTCSHLVQVCNMCKCICVWSAMCINGFVSACVSAWVWVCNLYTFIHITNYTPRTILYMCIHTHTPSTRTHTHLVMVCDMYKCICVWCAMCIDGFASACVGAWVWGCNIYTFMHIITSRGSCCTYEWGIMYKWVMNHI